jgi:RNA polymerase sigma-70 factor, ECF subfamily
MFTIDLSPVTPEKSAKKPVAKKYTASPAAVTEAAYDAALVERFKAGDEEAFSEIARRYRTKLYLAALGFLRSRSDAEEMAQDALIRAHRGLANFRGDSSLATWLHRVVCNLARNRYWHMKRRGAGCTLSLDYEISEGSGETFSAFFADEGATASQEISLTEFSALVAECMEQLEPHHREILTLRNVAELSYEEIARKLGLAEGTVKSRIARAREFLSIRLSERCPDFGERAAPIEWFEPARGRNLQPIAAA